MAAPFLLLFLINSQIQSQKLTTDENELNNKNCGVHFLGQPIQMNRLVKKSYGGREFEENEYPWTAVILRHGQARCSGVQISPRHILTAAHCVLVYNELERILLCAMNMSYSVVPVLSMPEDMSVFIGGGKIHCGGVSCQYNKTLYKVKKITAKEMDVCSSKDDLALIELSLKISEYDSTPISSSPITFDNPIGHLSHGQQVVALRYDAVDESLHQIRTRSFAKTLCPGDSGGPLFQVDQEGRHILVGITSAIDLGTQPNQNVINYFNDVRANLDWICKYSGVCPVEEEFGLPSQ